MKGCCKCFHVPPELNHCFLFHAGNARCPDARRLSCVGQAKRIDPPRKVIESHFGQQLQVHQVSLALQFRLAPSFGHQSVSSTTGDHIIDHAIEAFAEEDEVRIRYVCGERHLVRGKTVYILNFRLIVHFRKLNLCNTSVRLKPLTHLLKNCPTLEYLNLTSCRGLPRGMKRLYSDREKVENLRDDIIGGKFNNDDSDD